MKSYKDVRKELAGDFEEAAGLSMPCSSCKAPTPHETLRNLGSMCHACFEHYCGDAFDDDAHKARYLVGLKRRMA